MKSIVVDNSVVIGWLLKEENAKKSADILRLALGNEFIVPSVWSYEIINVLWVAQKRGHLSVAETPQALKELNKLPIKIHDLALEVISTQVLDISREFRLTIYDASYVFLAKSLKIPIASFDQDILRACQKMGIKAL